MSFSKAENIAHISPPPPTPAYTEQRLLRSSYKHVFGCAKYYSIKL